MKKDHSLRHCFLDERRSDMSGLSYLLLLMSVFLVVATLPLIVELLVLSVTALMPQARVKDQVPQADQMPITVLIPAHNEETLIGRCRSEEHTSELQSLRHLVCRLLL